MSEPNSPSYPNQENMEIPLLKAIAARGGAIWFSQMGGQIEDDLADYFGLSDDDRMYSSPKINAKGHRKWRNHIQYVRLKLVSRGELDNSTRDQWVVTERGYHRIGVTPPKPR